MVVILLSLGQDTNPDKTHSGISGASTYCFVSLIGYVWENGASQVALLQPNFQISESIGYE